MSAPYVLFKDNDSLLAQAEWDAMHGRTLSPTLSLRLVNELDAARAEVVRLRAKESGPQTSIAPLLGPRRCLCDEPLKPYVVMDAGEFGRYGCARCRMLLLSAHQPILTLAEEALAGWRDARTAAQDRP